MKHLLMGVFPSGTPSSIREPIDDIGLQGSREQALMIGTFLGSRFTKHSFTSCAQDIHQAHARAQLTVMSNLHLGL